MAVMCAYQNCLSVKFPCSSTAFFRLPTDARRSTWVKNSGNKSLINISAKAHRFFCENHFRQCDIRTQFNRKILRKHAVPIEHQANRESQEPEPKRSSHYTALHRTDDNNEKAKEEANLVIEKLEDDTNNLQFYENFTFVSQDNDSITEENLEDSYTLLDFYLPADECAMPKQHEEQAKHKEDKHNDSADIFYEKASSNHVEASTTEINSNIDEEQYSDGLELEPQLPAKKRKPNEEILLEDMIEKSDQVTTSNNDYQEDKHFALSLVGYFQRLPKGKKALAKLKVLQYLTQLEFDSNCDL